LIALWSVSALVAHLLSPYTALSAVMAGTLIVAGPAVAFAAAFGGDSLLETLAPAAGWSIGWLVIASLMALVLGPFDGTVVVVLVAAVTLGTLVFGIGADMLWSDGLLDTSQSDADPVDLRSVTSR